MIVLPGQLSFWRLHSKVQGTIAEIMGGFKMDNKIRRAIVAVIVSVVVYFVSDLLIGWNGYDRYLEAIKVLTGVIGAGCYWIGSNES